MGGIEALVAFIVGNAVEHLRVCPAVVVAVDYLAHEPEIALFALAEASYPLEEVEVDAVGSVKADAVDAKGLYPVVDSVDDVVTDADIAEIEFYEVIVAVPAFIPEWVAAGTLTAEVEVLEPVAVARPLTLLLNIDELGKFPSYMVENAVKDDPDAVFVELVADEAEGIVVAETTVNGLVVNGIVAVLDRLENGSEVNGVNIHLLEMRYPVEHLVETVDHIASVIEFGCSAEAERVDVVDYGVVIPIHISILL